SPAWVIKDGFLYFGANRDAVAAAAKFSGKNFADNAKFNQIRDQLKPAAPGGFEFADLPQTTPDFYKAMEQESVGLRQLLEQAGLEMDQLPLPPLETVQKEVTPQASVSWRDAKGYHTRASKPFPLSDVLVAQKVVGVTSVGVAGLGVGILVPSLARASETANRVKRASNMRQIGQAILLYANENQGKYPPDLGTLITTQDITWECFACPDTHTKLPKNVNQPGDIAKWVTTHSDYVYVGQKLDNNAPANKVILYEGFKDHGDGC